MGEKKRNQPEIDDKPATDAAGDAAPSTADSLKPMERRKRRKAMDKERHHADAKPTEQPILKTAVEPQSAPPPSSTAALPGFHLNVFGDLSSPDAAVRETAAQTLVSELCDVQAAFERLDQKTADEGAVQLEAEKEDGLENCAPSLRYAIRRLIRGVSSSRECARQGFALGLTLVVAAIPAVRVGSVMKLIVDLLEVTSAMKGQEARECFLGRLFAYGALARSGRVAGEWISDNESLAVKDFVGHLVALAGKKRYLGEPVVSVILDMASKLPPEALLSQVLKAPGMEERFQKATVTGDPDVLYLALKLQERVPMDSEAFGKLLPCPFISDNLFAREQLLTLAPCLKESTFCTPRVHSIWPLLVNLLSRDVASQDDDATTRSISSKKHKRNRKGSSSEEITKNIRNFCEVVIEESLLQSSHDRKLLAFNVLLLLLPWLPASCTQVVLPNKLVNCLMDILSTESSWLYSAAHHFLKELLKWAGDDDNRRVGVIISLQKHSNGRFDYFTRTHTVKELVSKFNTADGCMLFVDELTSLFVDEGAIVDEPSDQSQTTDENSEIGSAEINSPIALENSDFLKIWVIDTMPRILKNLKLSSAKSSENSEIKSLEAKFRVQTEVMKFLAVQGLFSASLGTEVTSFELQEKFTWPKAASSSSLRRTCIEQLQSLLEDAQKGESLNEALEGHETNDLGSYFIRFLTTLCNIPSVSLYRSLNEDDEKAFKKLQLMESRLLLEERNIGPGVEANKLHALRYLLIQLLLQVLLHPGEFSEAASELVICCKKAFPAAAQADSDEEEDDFDDNDMPEFMDVLVDTLLSLLPQSSGAIRFSAEQVFRFFCDNITDDGLLQMLRIVKKDLKPVRHQPVGSDEDEDDDDLLGIEEGEETDEGEAVDTADSDDHADVSDGIIETEATEANDDDVSKELHENDEIDEDNNNVKDLSDSDESDGGMDDDAMFRVESQLARLFKERKLASGHDNANSQLVPFKLRVLSLLEIYLQRNPGKPQVLTIYSSLAQAFVKSQISEGSEQLGQRLNGILQKKIFKAKDYPKSEEIQYETLVTFLDKSMKSASRSRRKAVSSLARASSLWLLKIIHARNFSKSELDKVVQIFQNILADYFNNKKCRFKSGFVKEVIRRHPWVGSQLFGFLLEKCRSAESEFRKVEALDMLDCIMRSWAATSKGDKDASGKSSKLLKKNLPALCELLQELLSKLPKKQARRSQVRKFCAKALHAITLFNLKKSFLKALKPDVFSACDSHLGAAFLPFKTSTT